MADIFREVSSQGWISRIGSSIKGVLVGGVLVLVCVVVLFWNEGRAVNEAKRIEEGQAACVSVDAAKVDPAYEHKEIHISGDSTTTDKPADDVFGVRAPAVRLKRLVEMYQWREKKEEHKKTKTGGGEETETTYSYDKVWSDELNDSSEFHEKEHRNPTQKPFDTMIVNAASVTVGAFRLTDNLIEMMEKFQPLSIEESSVTLPEKGSSKIKFANGGLYIGADPSSPTIGDTRIHFQIVKPGPVSVIGLQTGNTFEPFVSPHGKTLMLSDGIVSANDMFAAEKARNAMITWLIRLGGFVVMWIGLMMLVRPLKVVADVLPFAGNLVEFAGGIVMLLVAGTVSFVTIGIAWLVYRPVLGIAMLVVAGGLVYLIVKKKKQAMARIPAIPNVTNFPPPPIPS